jgi:hypothetical protein
MFRYTVPFVLGVYVAQEYNLPRIKPVIDEYVQKIEKWLTENKK